MRRCLASIDEGVYGLNQASKQFGISKPTIRRHRLGLNKYAKGDVKMRGGPCALPKEVEEELVGHIQSLDDLFFGISIVELRKLAYQVACAHGISTFSDAKKSANKTWYYNFMRRHPDLRLRSPEATSMARSKGFNRQDVADFFQKYTDLIDEHGLTAERIYNVDESGHSTVQTPSKVISQRGKRQVGAITSAERGTNTTGVYCQSAVGHFLPPMLIFKRKRMSDSLKVDAPTGTVFACTDSGWIDIYTFTEYLRFFINTVKSSKENKHLLLLDGHTSHSKNLDAINLARENGVIMLSFPPHCTHKMQPLDVSFFKSLKSWYNIEVESYLRSSNGKTVSVYLVSKLVGKAFLKAATMANAVNGFRKAGLWPPNQHVFDAEFDRIEALTPLPATVPTTPVPSTGPTTGPTTPVLSTGPMTPLPATVPTTPVPSTGPTTPLPATVPTTPVPSTGPTTPLPATVPTTGPTTPKSPTQISVPTKGDGRCFFRSVVIGLNCDLQSAKRDAVTGEVLDTMKSIQETAQADNLRTRVISHMCEKLRVEPDAAILSADMPDRLQFHTLAERIVHMSQPTSMIGELEIQSTVDVLGREIHVHIATADHIVKYVPTSANLGDGPLSVHYLPNEDAGHYEAYIATSRVRIRDLSPIPNIYGLTRKVSRGSKSLILTESPYKDALEKKRKERKEKEDKKKNTKVAKRKIGLPNIAPKNVGPKKKVPQRKRARKMAQESWYCNICGEDVEEAMVQCVSCLQWVHNACAEESDMLRYVCDMCK